MVPGITFSAVEDFNNDDNAKVGVLYGIGGNFCAGYDLKELGENPPLDLAPYGRGPMVSLVSFKIHFSIGIDIKSRRFA